MLVHNILQNNVSQYFLFQEHSKNTRNNKCSACLPGIRTECARKGFYYMGAKIFNELPVAARISDNLFAFREILSIIFV